MVARLTAYSHIDEIAIVHGQAMRLISVLQFAQLLSLFPQSNTDVKIEHLHTL